MKDTKAFEDFEEYLLGDGKAEKTVGGYIQDLTLFAAWFLEINDQVLSPETMTKIDIRQYREYLLEEQQARPATINRKLAALRAYSEWAKTSGKVEYSLTNGIKNIEEQAHAPKWLLKKDQQKLLRELEKEVNAARTPPAKRQAIRDYSIVVLLLNTGLRISELCDLDMGDIVSNPRSGHLRVRKGKGTKERVVPLNKTARDVIEDWQTVRPETSSRALYINKYGDRVAERVIQRTIQEMGRRAEVDATPHTLRHSFAKNLVDSGVSLEKVAALMGHAKLETTMGYTTPGQTDLERAVDKLG